MKDLNDLEKTIGVHFTNADVLKEALTHRSYLNEHPEWALPHNERLEYLGDAVLELAVTEELFTRFPELPEGELTVYRAALVNYQRLAIVAGEIDLQQYLFMSRGEQADNSKAREVILANAIEALIGAIHLDGGYETVKNFIHRFVLVHLPEIIKTKSYRDAKSELQEIVQEETKITPSYRVLGESGPAHRKVFQVGVFLGEEKLGEGSGASKQEAEVEAARSALEKMNNRQ